MNLLQILTDVAPETEEVVEETFNLAQTLNDNVGVVLVCIAAAGLAIYAIATYFNKRKKGRK